MRLYLFYTTPTCFGQISWPSSGSYKCGQRLQHVWHMRFTSRPNLLYPEVARTYGRNM